MLWARAGVCLHCELSNVCSDRRIAEKVESAAEVGGCSACDSLLLQQPFLRRSGESFQTIGSCAKCGDNSFFRGIFPRRR